MDAETYEQIEISAEFRGEKTQFLQDGMEVVVEFYDTTPLGVSLTQKRNHVVVEKEPIIKGQTQKS